MPSVLSRRALFTVLSGSAAGLVPGRRAAAQVPPVPRVVVHDRPIRVVDTRNEISHGGKLVSGTERVFSLLPAIGPAVATAALVNLTITETEGAGFLAVAAGKETDPYDVPTGFGLEPPAVAHSNINWSSDAVTLANLVVTAMSAEYAVGIKCGGNGRTHMLIDVVGYIGNTEDEYF